MRISENRWRDVFAVVLLVGTGGCAAVGATAVGVGASTGITHTLSGITYRTFSAPMPKVKSATMTAFQHMGIRVSSSSRVEGSEVIKAQAANREIQVELEPLTPNTTRMRAVAKNGLFYDSATATEIILQTEKALGVQTGAIGTQSPLGEWRLATAKE